MPFSSELLEDIQHDASSALCAVDRFLNTIGASEDSDAYQQCPVRTRDTYLHCTKKLVSKHARSELRDCNSHDGKQEGETSEVARINLQLAAARKADSVMLFFLPIESIQCWNDENAQIFTKFYGALCRYLKVCFASTRNLLDLQLTRIRLPSPKPSCRSLIR